ncbi:MAG: MotA/TolQ/ExbB proton channel family protein [Candidatus Omnitrophica bacterium]|nr:MotA/TolQ/ExbB proton channel family protein [Candidatus Omnitrophota bacterium]MDD5487531.1 MotA/TolQ/ExbB proton channel family protein [Candidatus Omnitrophota bacterium]
MNIRKRTAVFFCLMNVIMTMEATAQGAVSQYIPDASDAENGMTLWQIIQSGGWVMVVLGFLSIAAVGLIIYYTVMIKKEKLIPDTFFEKTVSVIERSGFQEAKMICENNNNLISDVLLAGLTRVGKEEPIIKEAIQDAGRRAVEDLWQKISYLADIASIAPMVGLLGTVIGMIQAFNVIAFQTGSVKPILLASGISKAMVTTAAGLMIAIPSMIFYSFFRGKVQGVIARLEDVSGDLYHLLVKKNIKR